MSKRNRIRPTLNVLSVKLLSIITLLLLITIISFGCGSSQKQADTVNTNNTSNTNNSEINKVSNENQTKFPGEPSFRKTHWGMSKNDVKRLESDVAHEEDDTLAYESSLGGLDAVVIYNFVEDKLVKAGYIITEEHTNDDLYISDYQRIKSELTKKYGTPVRDESLWLDDLFRDKPGMAVSAGHLRLISSWETPDTEITCMLAGDNFEVRICIYYDSKELVHLWENREAKEVAEQL